VIETLSWSTLESYLLAGAPWLLSMGGSRQVRIGYEPHRARLYVELPIPPETTLPPSALSEVRLEVREDTRGCLLQISTDSSHFFREFHRFAGLLTEVFEAPAHTAVEAFEEAIRRWQEFTASHPVLTTEQQTDLVGELIVLGGVIEQAGPAGLSAWTARDTNVPGRHDFRLRDADLEVKTTRGTSRQHVVHGLEQFTPAVGRPLYVLSIRVETAGHSPGQSLSGYVHRIREQLKSSDAARYDFDRRLAATNFLDRDQELYSERLRQADSPRLIPVDAACPRITNAVLGALLAPAVTARISDVNYRVSLDGLGAQEGDALFAHVLDGIRLAQ
jgi:hypothetical protein